MGTFSISGNTLAVQLSNQANGYVTADAIRIERISDLPTVIDNADPSFSISGPNWSTPGGTNAYHGSYVYAPPGNGSDSATWTFTVSPGIYRVSATWADAASIWATNCTLHRPGWDTVLGTTLINQEIAPDDAMALGASWEFLGTFGIG